MNNFNRLKKIVNDHKGCGSGPCGCFEDLVEVIYQMTNYNNFIVGKESLSF